MFVKKKPIKIRFSCNNIQKRRTTIKMRDLFSLVFSAGVLYNDRNRSVFYAKTYGKDDSNDAAGDL